MHGDKLLVGWSNGRRESFGWTSKRSKRKRMPPGLDEDANGQRRINKKNRLKLSALNE